MQEVQRIHVYVGNKTVLPIVFHVNKKHHKFFTENKRVNWCRLLAQIRLHLGNMVKDHKCTIKKKKFRGGRGDGFLFIKCNDLEFMYKWNQVSGTPYCLQQQIETDKSPELVVSSTELLVWPYPASCSPDIIGSKDLRITQFLKKGR